jgi:short-subunit dehydrogenase
VHTEFHQRAGLEMDSMSGPMWLRVDDVVDVSLADVAKGKVMSIPGMQYKALAVAGRLIPRGVVRAAVNKIGRGSGRT